MATINGRQYEFADLTLILAGRDVTGFRGIKYTEKQEKEHLYGKGNLPMSIQRGNISYEGEITFTQSELNTLRLLGKGSILRLNLNAVVCYGNPAAGDAMTVDKLYGIQFTESAMQFKQGDKFADITVPFICTGIEYGA
jgi:hypothetical protein